VSRFAVALLLLLAACSECGKHRSEPAREPERQRRVIEPPSRGVRALPPYAIRADGVGPYKLGASVSELLDQLPSGPRITQLTIPGLVHRDMLRAEDDAILIGAEPQGKATFVAVVKSEIARTEGGIHVGSTGNELVRALGAPVDDPDRARDPRVVVPTGMKNARIVLDGDHISAIVVTVEPERPVPLKADAPDNPCTRPPGDHDKGLFGICLTSAGELVHREGEDILLVARDGEKPISAVRVPGLVFAVALRNPMDNRDDLIAISRAEDGTSWSLSGYRLAEGKLVRTIEPSLLYQLTAANARWIGAELKDLDLYLELTSRSDAIEVGGLLTTRIADKIRDIVVISPVPVARRRAKPASHEAVDAGTSETTTEGTR